MQPDTDTNINMNTNISHETNETTKGQFSKNTVLTKKDDKNTPKKENNKGTMPLFLSIIALGLSTISLIVTLLLQLETGYVQPTTITTLEKDGNSANFTEGSIADVANKVSKSVVSITTETRTTSWFGQSSTSAAAGTGFIVSQDGYILTNKHVITGANKINVILSDGTTYSNVKVAEEDPLNDIAFLKIADVSDLPAATLGDSKTITIGQQVLAIGNALGQYQNTVTSGIVSGTGRSITATDSSYSTYETLTDMIQTDAAINAGNSGGPLVNAAGEIIGINTATSSEADGIGFSIPISSIKGMLSQLLETGKASRAYIGVYSINITPSVAQEYDLPVNSGAYLYYESAKYGTTSAIVKGSPADEAGLKSKDIVIAVNGIKVGQSGSITSLLGEYKPKDTVQLTVLRDGKEKNINITLGEYNEDK